LLSFFDLISSNTLLIGWMGKYLVLFAGFLIWGLWSAVVWFRHTPSAERGPAFRRALKLLPGALAWLTVLMIVGVGIDILEKRYGVPFIVSAGVLFIVFYAVNWWLDNRRNTAAKS
jgi:hypothetical protein